MSSDLKRKKIGTEGKMGDKSIADVMERVMDSWNASEYKDAVQIRYISAGIGG